MPPTLASTYCTTNFDNYRIINEWKKRSQWYSVCVYWAAAFHWTAFTSKSQPEPFNFQTLFKTFAVQWYTGLRNSEIWYLHEFGNVFLHFTKWNKFHAYISTLIRIHYMHTAASIQEGTQTLLLHFLHILKHRRRVKVNIRGCTILSWRLGLQKFNVSLNYSNKKWDVCFCYAEIMNLSRSLTSSVDSVFQFMLK